MDSRWEARLLSPPHGYISSVQFAPSIDHLAVASWDKTVRVYDVEAGHSQPPVTFHHAAKVLGVCWSSKWTLFSGDADGCVKTFDVIAQEGREVGRHGGPVTALRFSPVRGAVLTGGADKTMRRWDPRSPCGVVETVPLAEEVVALDVAGPHVAVALAGRDIRMYDTRHLARPLQRRESALRHATRSLRCTPDGLGYAVTSVEGRVAQEWFDPTPERQVYAFRCPRLAPGAVRYPVSALAFLPRHGVFATGDHGGHVHFWNGPARKHLSQLRRFLGAVPSLDFNAAGTLLAVAVSPLDNPAPDPRHPVHAVFVRTITEAALQPPAPP